MIEKLKKLIADELMAVNSSHMIERLIQYDFSLDEIKEFFPNMTAEALERYRNPNAMAFAHWLDEQMQEQTAYTELKEWCEKYLGENEYNAQDDNGEGLPYIDLCSDDEEITIWFFEGGSFSDITVN